MNTIRMIAIDLDDTLLHDDISLSAYTRDVLRKAMAENIKIVIATGRMFQAARPWGKFLGIGDVPMICYTGAYVGLCESGTVLQNETIDLSLAQAVLDLGKEYHWYMHTYIDDELYVPFYDIRTEIYERQCDVKAHVLGEAFWTLPSAPTKILSFEREKEAMDEVKALLHSRFGEVTNQVMSKPTLLEMNKKGVSKGRAVRKLCDEYDISTDELMVFGNGQNDISMFQLTPWSFAVGNATEEAKKEAHFVVESNNDDGVAKAIERYLRRD